MKTTASIWALAISFNQRERHPAGSWRFLMGALMLSCLGFSPLLASETVYQTPAAFLAQAFSGQAEPEMQVIWATGETGNCLSQILGHPYAQLRIRYWRSADRTAWILDEIGKEAAITFGLAIENQRILNTQLLTYRESRGWEVHSPSFLKQFQGLQLNEQLKLNGTIDGISGATLSVRALERMARAGLFLHRQVVDDQGKPTDIHCP